MASLSVRKLDKVVYERLRVRAALHGVSMEEEVRQILVQAVTPPAKISDYGLSILPVGLRRNSMRHAFEKVIEEAFAFRVLSFSPDAAHLYGRIMSHRKELGRPMSVFDGQIASIAHAHEATLATRNVKDFEDCGLTIIDPF